MNIKQILEQNQVQPEELDGMVYEAAEQMASRANNEGMSEQLNFIANAGFSDNDVLEELGLSHLKTQL